MSIAQRTQTLAAAKEVFYALQTSRGVQYYRGCAAYWGCAYLGGNRSGLLISGKGGATTSSGPASGPEPIIFAPSISYDHALMLLTDIGLQPSLECAPYADHYTPGSTLQPQAVWQPVGQKETFSKTHQIWVYPTFSAPPDWRLRIVKIPGVQFGDAHFLVCSHVIYGTPPPGVMMPLTSAQAGTYARITFTSSTPMRSPCYHLADE